MTETIGPFELRSPVPAVRRPRLLMSLRPWIDVGSVGTIALAFLEERLGARPIAQLARPGNFYDFTRYRPMLTRTGGRRQVTAPNTVLHYAEGKDGRDWLLLHALEPHNRGEDFVDGLMALMKRLEVSEYVMIGSMYSPVPHTRPPVASGGAAGESLRERLASIGVRDSGYEGPTSILARMGTQLPETGVETATLILQVPAYAQMEHDYRSAQALLGMLSIVFGLELDPQALEAQAREQLAALEASVAENPELKAWIGELETAYDHQHAAENQPEDPAAPLSPELERFLRDVEGRLGEN